MVVWKDKLVKIKVHSKVIETHCCNSACKHCEILGIKIHNLAKQKIDFHLLQRNIDSMKNSFMKLWFPKWRCYVKWRTKWKQRQDTSNLMFHIKANHLCVHDIEYSKETTSLWKLATKSCSEYEYYWSDREKSSQMQCSKWETFQLSGTDCNSQESTAEPK